MTNENPFDFSRYSGASSTPSVPDVGTATSATATPAAPAASTASTASVDLPFGSPRETASSWGTATAAAPVPRSSGRGAPTLWLSLAVGSAVVAGAVAALLGSSPVIAIACWVVAGPVAILLLAIYARRSTAWQATSFSRSRSTAWAYRIALIVVFAAIVVCAAQIAVWAGRL